MAKFKIARGTQNAYNLIRTKDNDTLYICTNTGNIYLGGTPLFESNSFIGASISGKIITITTHGANGTAGSGTPIDLGAFQDANDVQNAINSAISSVFKPSGSLAANGIVQSLLVAGNLGNVYNVTEQFATDTNFVEGTGKTYPAGTNIVVVNTGTAQSPQYKFDVLAGFVDLSGYVTKVANPTSGNFASLDSNGNIQDSGNKASDFKTKQTAVSDPSANGTTLTAIATVSQNANGEISVTKKTIQDGTTSQKGVVQLEDSHTSNSTTKAATPKNVKEAYDLADSKMSDVKVGTDASDPSTWETVNNNGTALLITESEYDRSDNKIATMNDVADAELVWIELGTGNDIQQN